MNDPINWAPGVSLEAVEKQVILKAFRWYRGNKTQCSISLGINVRTLERKLEEYEQAAEKQREAEERDVIERGQTLDRMRGINPQTRPEESGESILRANAGLHVQPATEISTEQPVPVPKRQEIQDMLPKYASPGGKSRGR